MGKDTNGDKQMIPQNELEQLANDRDALNADDQAFVDGYDPVDNVDAVRDAIRRQNEAQANREKH